MSSNKGRAAGLSVRMADLLPAMQQTLSAGGEVSLTITGTSMVPTIRGGRDQVTLTAAPAALKKYDLPLYRRDNGQFVLHRIVAVADDGTFTCCGDHQWALETGVRPDQILAVTVRICRKGKQFPVTRRSYRLWVRVWVFARPIRRIVFGTYGAVSKLWKKRPQP